MNLLQECKGAKRIGISGHIRPDGDCVGACLALYQYLRKCMPECEVKVFLEKPSDIFGEIKGFSSIDSDFPKEQPFDVYFALDCAQDRLGEAEKYFVQATKKINIDHHISNPGCGDVNYIMPKVGSTCELIYDLIEKEMLDKELAMAIYIGMIHDTGVFQYSNTTPDTMQKAAHLISFGFDFPRLIEETFYQKTYAQSQVMGQVLLESTPLMGGRCIAGLVDQKTMDKYQVGTKDLDGIVNQLRNIKGVDCAIFMYETNPTEYKVSLRSNEKVDVAKVVSFFGGGGHVRAAGCTMQGTYEECVEKLSLHIEEQLC